MWSEKTNKTFMDAQYAEFIANKTGYYTATSTSHMVLLSVPMLHGSNTEALLARFRKTDAAQFLRSEIDGISTNAYKRQHSILLENFATNESAVDENYTSGKSSILVKPLSRGYVEARTNNIWDPPTVNHRTFSHPLDMENVLASLRMARRILNAKEMKPLNPVETAPGLRMQSDDDLKEWIRENMSPGGAHMCCSVPMGSVLDTRMRVLGLNGLRVVDTSSWPMIPGGHTTQVLCLFLGCPALQQQPLTSDSVPLMLLRREQRILSKRMPAVPVHSLGIQVSSI